MMTRIIRLLCVVIVGVIMFSSCAKKTPEDKYLAAIEHLKKREVYPAKIKLKEIIKEHADDPIAYNAYMTLADCYAGERDFEEQRRVLQTAIDKFGIKSDQGFNAFAMKISSYDGEAKLIVKSIRPVQASQGDGDDGSAEEASRSQKAKENTQKLYGSAIDEIKKVLEQLGEDHKYHWAGRVKLGYLFEQNEEFESAKEIYTSFLKQEEIKDEIYKEVSLKRLAELHRKLNETDEQIAVYEGYLSKYPDAVEAGLVSGLIGGCYGEKDDDEKAQVYFDRGIELLEEKIEETIDVDEKAYAMFLLVQVYDLEGESEKAIEICERIWTDFSGSDMAKRAMFSAAIFAERAGLREKAMELLAKLLEDSKDPREQNEIKNMMQKLIGAAQMSSDTPTTQTETVE